MRSRAAASPARSTTGQPDRDSSYILVVDDDREVRDAMTELLTDAGYEVVCKSDGQQALTHLRRRPAPAAILLDLFMPNMNGWEFMKHLKVMRKVAAVPVIMVTGTSPQWGYPVAASLVVRKPVDPERLLRILRDAIKASLAA